MDILKLELRGHHIGSFADDYFGFEFYDENSQKKQVTERAIPIDSPYGIGFEQYLTYIHDLIRNNPEMTIEVKEGYDSICHVKIRNNGFPPFNQCPLLEDKCISEELNEDEIVNQEYNLRIGQTMTASEMIELITDYAYKNRIRSPRDQIKFIKSIGELI